MAQPQELKILFDQLLWPIDTKEPWRIGAGGGLRFQGRRSTMSASTTRALTPEEVGVVALPQSRSTRLPRMRA